MTTEHLRYPFAFSDEERGLEIWIEDDGRELAAICGET
jgi:hypothetical protein